MLGAEEGEGGQDCRPASRALDRGFAAIVLVRERSGENENNARHLLLVQNSLRKVNV
jgi:hypothetical protein